MLTPEQLIRGFIHVARLCDAGVKRQDIRFEELSPPHKPTKLPTNTIAVYVFLLGDRCLKVGKAGPKTAARFLSQHYGTNARSTLTKSILRHKSVMIGLAHPAVHDLIYPLDEKSIGDWIQAHTTRWNFFLSATYPAHILNLLESYMQARLRPRFEGKVFVDAAK